MHTQWFNLQSCNQLHLHARLRLRRAGQAHKHICWRVFSHSAPVVQLMLNVIRCAWCYVPNMFTCATAVNGPYAHEPTYNMGATKTLRTQTHLYILMCITDVYTDVYNCSQMQHISNITVARRDVKRWTSHRHKHTQPQGRRDNEPNILSRDTLNLNAVCDKPNNPYCSWLMYRLI